MPSFDYYSDLPCSAPLKLPPPYPNASLFTLILLFRHGMRSPAQIYHFTGNEGYWNCNGIKNTTKFLNVQVNGEKYKYLYYNKSKDYLFPPSCGRSCLLDGGVKELYELGQLYYNYSVERNIISSTDLHDMLSIFSIRSSFSPRCIESALSFLNGFFHNYDGLIYEPIQIITGGKNNEPLSASPFHSKVIYNNLLKYLSNEEYKNRYNLSEEIIKKIHGKYLNVSYPVHEFESLTFGDFVNTVRCAKQEKNVYRTIDHKQPPENEQIIDPNLHKFVMSNVYYFEGNLINYSTVSVVPIFELIIQKLKETDKKFNMFSAHSETLSTILSYLGEKMELPPPYRSHFLIETWKPNNGSQPFLRISFNGEVLRTILVDDFIRSTEEFIRKYGENKNDKDIKNENEKGNETDSIKNSGIENEATPNKENKDEPITYNENSQNNENKDDLIENADETIKNDGDDDSFADSGFSAYRVESDITIENTGAQVGEGDSESASIEFNDNEESSSSDESVTSVSSHKRRRKRMTTLRLFGIKTKVPRINRKNLKIKKKHLKKHLRKLGFR